MTFLFAHYFAWMCAAFFLGIAVGWLFAGRRRDAGGRGFYLFALGIVGAALAVAFLHGLPGRFGHGLEVVLLLLVSYLFGCLVGEPLRLALAAPDERAPAPSLAGGESQTGVQSGQRPQADYGVQPAQMLAGAAPLATTAAAAAPIATAALEELVSDEHKPLLLAAPPASGADDLKLIWGVGPKLETMLNEMGVYRFAQIAEWNDMNLKWVDQRLQAFRGRAVRDRWIEQAKRLADGWRPDNAVGERFED